MRDSSRTKILACTNAVRVNPDVLSDASCFASVQAELKNPPRLPLNYDANLTAAAVYHNNWMVSLSGEPSLGDRADMFGYDWWRIAENVAAGYGSAKSVVSGWLCSSGHRANMFSCSYVDIGIGSDPVARYYTQILACTNAVRVNPDVLSDASCFASVQAELKNPPRLPLNSNANLTAAAVYHNNWMVSYSTMSHQLSGEPSLGNRADMFGYDWWRMAENIAAGYGSAKSVVSGWLCSSGHRANMFSCSYEDIGIGSDPVARYYTQILACTNAVRVNPDVLSDASCFASVQAELKNPPRLPLNFNANLTAAAVYHNNWMVSYSTMSHQLD
ncbi:hypothetical protein GPECTOR_115g329 [Gonium pectorale]|uniref:SCP domain-containing protein n=1 Tax=Gonium pectorale TaxID=33097 RepID=A0A150G047_GONPE|nr:hypothetical protein GPECTOR_115g329 [Gonium pectorale]|eukprot:KXZ42835.1 hypothetical protein GPECTOR_115g329 [Gonium pectorale]